MTDYAKYVHCRQCCGSKKCVHSEPGVEWCSLPGVVLKMSCSVHNVDAFGSSLFSDRSFILAIPGIY